MSVLAHHLRDLYKIFAAIENEEESKKILQDILTPQELESLAERWQIIKKLSQGMTQRDIAKDLNISISKITRGSRAFQYGTGGFEILLDRLKHDKKVD